MHIKSKVYLQSAVSDMSGAVLMGSVVIILSDFLFSRLSFSFVIELPFLKFIKYMLTEWSIKENAVKND